ncbi:hypothetical protein ABWU93_11640 [Xanthomonas translucens pv. translucens]|uniref:hypothetical protein n=1 Tax=Xanthomonas campestris pv. translucens TaxID=343 RepID=UPI003F70C2B0
MIRHAAAAPGGVHLLGRGLDAIVQRRLPELSLEDAFLQHQRRAPAVTPQQRLARYERALAALPDRQTDLRRMIGEGYQAAWRRGRWPRLVIVANAIAGIERSHVPC